ncbi:FAD-dependent monooxygenase [Nocardiopsis coralliicola]
MTAPSGPAQSAGPQAEVPSSADVAVVGAGPAGLTLAADLATAGIGVAVLERDSVRPPHSRGFTVNARSLDLLARRGAAAALVAEGWTAPHAPFTGLPVELGLAGAATDHPFTLGIPQARVEDLLEERARALGAGIFRGCSVTGLTQDGSGVEVSLAFGGHARTLRAAFLVGCDGGRSTVRRSAGIGFPGTAPTSVSLLGDVVLADPAAVEFGENTGPGGTVFAIPRPDHVRLVAADPDPPDDRDAPFGADRLAEVASRALGRPIEIADARWLTRFGNAARQAERYRSGRVLLAGDAAHIQPGGAVGIDAAIEDAVNLGWKLAAEVAGRAPEGLLDSYHAERHPAGARLIAHCRAQELLAEGSDELEPVRRLLQSVLESPHGATAAAEAVTGLDNRYGTPGPDAPVHPWLGRLVPNLETAAPDGAAPVPLASRIGPGHCVLLSAGAPAPHPPDGYRVRAAAVRHTPAGVPPVAAVLLRPDGHAAWIALPDGRTSGLLEDALEQWCPRA